MWVLFVFHFCDRCLPQRPGVSKAPMLFAARGLYSDQALFQALDENFSWQLDADEHHFAVSHLIRGPGRPQIAAHELVHTLEDDLALGAFHVEYTLVAQHARAVNIDDGPQEVFQFGRIEGPR